MTRAVVTTLIAFALIWLSLLMFLVIMQPDKRALRDAMHHGPDALRLVRNLLRDASLPRSVRVRIVLLVAYLLFPIDLVPDVLPVIGYADDFVLIAIVLRSVIRAAGPIALERHWTGSPSGLRAIKRLCGLPPEGSER